MSESKVTELDAHRPHVRITCIDGDQHVLPVAYFTDIIVGNSPIEINDENVCVWRQIVHSWLDTTEAPTDE